MTAKIYLDNAGGSFALYKERDVATWDEDGPQRTAVAAETEPDDLPEDLADGFDVSGVRTVMVRVIPSTYVAVWSIKVFGGVLVPDEEDQEWDLFDGGEYEDKTGRMLIKLDVVGVDYIHILVTAVDTGTISINYGLVELDNE